MSKPNKRIIFTADARLSVRKFADTTPPATGTTAKPEKIATISGYAIVWNAVSSDRGGYKVRLMPGSARFTAEAHALFHHDYSKPLGDTTSGTLRILPADDVGIPVEIDLPDTSYGRDCEELVEGGRVRGMSFAMTTSPTASEVKEGADTILNVTDFLCDEVTVTAIPAFTSTSIGMAEDDEPEDEDDTVPEKMAARGEIARERVKVEMYALYQRRL